MTDQPSLLEAQRRVREASDVPGRGEARPPSVARLPPAPDELPWTTSAGVLALAGWESKVRMGRRIWRDPGEPFGGWFSEEMAYGQVERGEA